MMVQVVELYVRLVGKGDNIYIFLFCLLHIFMHELVLKIINPVFFSTFSILLECYWSVQSSSHTVSAHDTLCRIGHNEYYFFFSSLISVLWFLQCITFCLIITPNHNTGTLETPMNKFCFSEVFCVFFAIFKFYFVFFLNY